MLPFLFDETYYLLRNPDVAAAVARGVFKSGAEHFEQFGKNELRDISALFDASYYLNAHPDVAAAGINPLEHYIRFGAAEGRNPSVFFDPAFYFRANPDVVASGMGALEHYLEFGAAEGRNPSARFDSAFYLNSSPDITASGMNALVHFVTYGLAEQRPNTLIDFTRLAATNPNFAVALAAQDGELLEDIVRQQITSAATVDTRSAPPLLAPTNILPANQTMVVGNTLNLLGVSVADADSAAMASYTLVVSSGTLILDTAVSGGITAGQVTGNSSSSLTITGATLAQINAILGSVSGLNFTAAGAGASTLTVTVNDGTLTDSDQLTITAAAAPPATINLSTLNGTNGFRLDGVAATNRSGISVSNAGDVNGDGFDDVIVGAYRASPNGAASGSSYVVFGAASGWTSTINLSILNGTNGFRLDGVAGDDRAGWSVSNAGDVNGDGFDDFTVGAPFADPNGGESGSSYVVFGKSSGWISSINLSTLDGTTGFRLNGEAAGDQVGRSVANAGDINGDGFDDVIVGARYADPNAISNSGSSYIAFGKASGFTSAINLSTLDGTTGFRLDGVVGSDLSGRSVSNAGDVNGDGFGDVIVSAHRADPNGGDSGSSYVVFGKASGFTSSINLSSLNGTIGFRLDGVAVGDNSGYSVSSAGDVNGDGFDDLIVGARLADGSNFGSSYVLFGKASGFTSSINLSTLNGTTGFRLDGVAAGDYSGASVSSAGDVNGDGFDDLIVGAYFADPNGGDSGSSYVVFGKASGFSSSMNLSTLNGTNGYRLDGVAASDLSGRSVSSAGDVNGDGFDDIVIGAQDADPNGGNSGSSYIIFGSNSNGAASHVGTSGNDTLVGNIANNGMIGGLGNDSISGGAGNDVIKGANGNDTITGGSGADRLWGGAGNDLFVYSASDAGATDTIYDFVTGTDDIDLSAFSGTFAFRGTSAFTGTANEVRYVQTGNNILIHIDSNANGITDFSIQLLGIHTLSSSDFVL